MDSRLKKPDLPPEFHRKGGVGALGLVAVMLFYFVGASTVNLMLWTGTGLPLAAKALLSIPLFVVAGQGVHLMGWIGHEGLHFNLSRSRHVSTVTGIVFSSMTVLFLEMGMVLDHWSHHRYTNTPHDPDLKLFARHRSFLARMLFTRMRANRLYLRRTLRLALGLPLDGEVTRIVFPFSLRTLRAYAWLNLAMAAFWAGVYLWLAQGDWRFIAIVFVGPAFAANVLSGLRSYIEHNGTDIGEFYNTRTRASWFWTWMDVGANYHLEHHLYPGVPQWRLPRVHRYLMGQGCYDGRCHIDHSVLNHYRYAGSRYTYPAGDGAVRGNTAEVAMY